MVNADMILKTLSNHDFDNAEKHLFKIHFYFSTACIEREVCG